MKIKFGLIVLLMAGVACTKNAENPSGSFLTGSGVFILNEGNFMGGNGSLSFYSYDSSKIYNDLFYNINGRPLGDIPNSLGIRADYAYILVNNSGKIEVINKNTIESVATINGLTSPRNISFAGNNKAYVTSMYSDSLTIINLIDNSISGYINLRRFSESIVISGSKAYVSNWIGPNYMSGNEVMVINTITDEVVDSIEVGYEPESMVTDKNNNLWILCNGGYARNNYAKLIRVNTITDIVEKEFQFSTKQLSPTCLQIDGSGETLYFLERGVHQMEINSSELPVTPLIPESGHFFYKLSINPVNNDILLTDAIDYQQSGYLLYYNKEGALVSEHTADIAPASMCYKLNDNFQTE